MIMILIVIVVDVVVILPYFSGFLLVVSFMCSSHLLLEKKNRSFKNSFRIGCWYSNTQLEHP